jgi:6,7-dimethyl-8-ribityllumazine synthase
MADPGLHRLPGEASMSRAGYLAGLREGSSFRVAVACARFNGQVTKRLLDGAEEALDRLGVASAESGGRLVCLVPGAFELPLAARWLLDGGRADAVVALGCVIRGETSHYDFVAGECAAGLQRVQLETGRPVAFGVLTTENLEQALARSGGELGNKGSEAVETVIEMLNISRQLEKGRVDAG